MPDQMPWEKYGSDGPWNKYAGSDASGLSQIGGTAPPVPKPPNLLTGEGAEEPHPGKFAQAHPVASSLLKAASIPNPEAMSAGPLAEGLAMRGGKALLSNAGKGLEDFNIMHPLSPKPLINLVRGTIGDMRETPPEITVRHPLSQSRVPVWTGAEPPPSTKLATTPIQGTLPSGRLVPPRQASPIGIDPIAPPGPSAKLATTPEMPAKVLTMPPPDEGLPVSDPNSPFSKRLAQVREAHGLKPNVLASPRNMGDVGSGSSIPRPRNSYQAESTVLDTPEKLAAAKALADALKK
jgi:hypothetical protein